MALFDKPLDLITENDLRSLVENEVLEGYQIEYKQSVSFKDKQDKIDFLAGLTAFGNTIGGDFLIGVTARNGIPVELPGWVGIDLDSEKQRIENLLRDQVEPRLNVKLREIRLADDSFVVVVRVPWSWAQPHMVRVDQVNRFYYRTSTGNDIMNVSQIRAAFAMSTGAEKQIEEFRRERLGAISAGRVALLTSVPSPTVVLHIVPLESLRFNFALDLEAAMKQARYLLPLGTGSNAHRYNLDGIASISDFQQPTAYSQLFRNGTVETASRQLLKGLNENYFIPSGALQRAVLQHMRFTMDLYQALGVRPPATALISLLGVRDLEFAVDSRYSGFMQHSIDRDDLLLPGTLIEDFGLDPIEICRPIFDTLWNAAGFARWFEYDRI
jgi:hypothetical protein